MSTIVRKARLDAAAAQVGQRMHSARTHKHTHACFTQNGAREARSEVAKLREQLELHGSEATSEQQRLQTEIQQLNKQLQQRDQRLVAAQVCVDTQCVNHRIAHKCAVLCLEPQRTSTALAAELDAVRRSADQLRERARASDRALGRSTQAIATDNARLQLETEAARSDASRAATEVTVLRSV